MNGDDITVVLGSKIVAAESGGSQIKTYKIDTVNGRLSDMFKNLIGKKVGESFADVMNRTMIIKEIKFH